MPWRWRWRAELYRVMRQIGFAPQVVDGMEMWQIATLLETDLKPKGVDPDRLAAEAHTLADRARAISGNQEEPTEDAADITDQVMKQMGINTG